MSRPEAFPRRFGTAAVACLLATAASAQTFVGVGLGDHPAPAAAAPTAAAATPVAPVPVPATVLRLMPGTLDGLQVTGEIGDLRWPVYLTAAQAAAPLRMQVGYLSAVSVLPDGSSLDVRVNGRSIGIESIDAAEGLRRIAFPVPANLLKPGYNELSIAVRQRHRVDCSVAATYELWTRIEPAATGLEMPPAVASITDAADMPALLPNPDGSMSIHVVLSGKASPAQIERLIRATQSIALQGRFLQPELTFVAGPDTPNGLDLVLGTRAGLAQLPRVAAALGGQGPLVRLLPAQGDGRPTLLVTGSDDAELDAAVAALETAPHLIGSPEGLRVAATYPARKSPGGEALKLSAFNLDSQDFNGRFFRKSINVELPADILASDYGRGIFDLAGGYASGLANGSQVRVDINGRSAGIIKLPYVDGDVFKHNNMFLPLGMMRPGFNRIDIYAETPRPEDATCAASGAKRFLFLNSSELRLPTLAHVSRMPELAATTGGALPFTVGVAHLVVPRPDRDTMAAALSLTTRAAVAAGRPLPFTFSTRMPSEDNGSSLVVAPARALDPAVMRQVGLDPAVVEKAWSNIPADVAATREGKLSSRWWLTDSEGPVSCRVPSHRGMIASPATASGASPPPGEAMDLVDTWTAGSKVSWSDRLAAGTQRMRAWAATAQATLLPTGSRATAPAEAINAAASLLMAQGVVGASGNVATIVTAPNSGALRTAVSCLFDPQVWSKVHGRLAALDASNGAVVAVDGDTFHYKTSDDVSLGNARLVSAGWFSLNPLAFVVCALLLALSLGLTTLMFVRGVGRRID